MAQGLYDITPLEPLIREGYTLLTPNSRLARRIKAEWDGQRAAAGERVWEPLSVLPVESWLLAQWQIAASQNLVRPLLPLGSAQVIELWRQVIAQQEHQSADFHLLRPAAAAELAAEARDTLLRWQVETATPQIRQLFQLDGDCGTFLQWLNTFEARLVKAGLCTLTDCLAQLPALSGLLPVTRVALVEFETLAPLLRTALAALCSEVREISASKPKAEQLVHPFDDKRAELQAVALWAAQLHRAKPEATIGIVLSDMQSERVSLEYLLRREFNCLGENYASLPVNFSVGIPLAQAPLVRDALATLGMASQHTTVPAVVRLLHSRYLDLPDAQSALAQRLIRQLYADGSEVVAIADLRQMASQVQLAERKGLALGRHLLASNEMRELRRKAMPSLWVAHFSKLLSAWGWPGTEGLDSLEYQQLALWQRTLDEFSSFDSVCGMIDYAAALALLRDSCHRQVSQPLTADSPIQVLGPLEAAGLSFEQLWLCGMQGANWPAAPRPNPFIPIALQIKLQMPHASHEREWAFADALLRQFARSSQILHASYCRQLDGVPDMPSAFLRDFAVQAMPEPQVVAARWSGSHRERQMEEVEDNTAPAIDTAQQSAIKGGSRVLEDQSHCPFRAFAQHRMEVEPIADFSVALSASERGSLLHSALYHVWGELGDSSMLQSLSDAQQRQTAARAAEAAIANAPAIFRRKIGAAYWQVEAQRLTALLHEWLDIERQRSAFSVLAREQDISLDLAELQIRLRVDRIDQLPDGSRVIIDYKSGVSTVQDWLGDRPSRPQLPLYSVVDPETVACLAFAQLRPRNSRFVGLGREAAAPGISTDVARATNSTRPAQDWSSLNKHWRGTLERLAREFVAGEARVDPLSPASCTWCGMQALCRIDNHADSRVGARLEITPVKVE